VLTKASLLLEIIMKPEIHPVYYSEASVTCVCGNTFTTGSVMKEIRADICSNCHPFYTGKQKMIDTEGRVDRFRRKYAQSGSKKV
jgi:large subunit ribosomal protein L31